MAYETHEARDAARRRLQTRMQRRETLSSENAPSGEAAHSPKRPATKSTITVEVQRPSVKSSRAGAMAFPSLPSAPPLAVLAIAAVIAALLIALSLTQCTSIAPADDAVDELAAGRRISTEALDLSNPAQAKLVGLIGEDETAKLLTAATGNADALWIAAHPGEFDSDGPEAQAKLLKLAADEPAAIDYVRAWPAQYPARKAGGGDTIAMSEKSPSPDVPDTPVPHLYQWDRRWGYTTYSSAPFGLAGCGPTALAMVARALTEERDATPYEMGKTADEHGYMTEFNGTGVEFFTEMADELGLHCEQLYPTGDSIRDALDDGAVIVANLGAGQFTDEGHFFVVAGLDEGRVIINDPYSVERSSQTWEADTIADESIALFSYTRI